MGLLIGPIHLQGSHRCTVISRDYHYCCIRDQIMDLLIVPCASFSCFALSHLRGKANQNSILRRTGSESLSPFAVTVSGKIA